MAKHALVSLFHFTKQISHRISSTGISSVQKLGLSRLSDYGSNIPNSINFSTSEGRPNQLLSLSIENKFDSNLINTVQKRNFSVSSCLGASFLYIHRHGPFYKRKKRNPLGENKPTAKGIVLKVFVKKPRKPNSANRKCVLVRLSSGKEMTAYVPGEGHTLQEHNVVLCKVGKLRDVPGVKIKCVRGKYDLGHVIKNR